MKKILTTLVLLTSINCVFAENLQINLDIQQGDKPVEIVGGDLYANIDGKLTEITVSPDRLPFKWNFKAGALRIKSFWATEKQFNSNSATNR